jgi:putative resolvase
MWCQLMYVTTQRAMQHYGVSADTLRRWANSSKIKFTLTKGKHRRYFVDSRNSKSLPASGTKPNKFSNQSRFVYARVSSNKQKSDLQHQIQFLADKFPDHGTITDVGSGLNFKRKGLQTILDGLFAGNIKEVVVASKDRLARFGFELIEDIFRRFDARIVVFRENDDRTEEEGENTIDHEPKTEEVNFKEELSDDIIAILTHFTAKYSGKRRYTTNKKGESKKISK